MAVVNQEPDGADTLGTIASSVRRVKWWIVWGVVVGLLSGGGAIAMKNRDLSDLTRRMDRSDVDLAQRISDWVPWRNGVDRKLDRSDQNQQYTLDELREIKEMLKDMKK